MSSYKSDSLSSQWSASATDYLAYSGYAPAEGEKRKQNLVAVQKLEAMHKSGETHTVEMADRAVKPVATDRKQAETLAKTEAAVASKPWQKGDSSEELMFKFDEELEDKGL